MLRLKKGTNVEGLLNYGFKPRYDEVTGEIEAYIKTSTESRFKALVIKRKKNKFIIKIFKRSNIEWRIIAYSDYFDLDTLYDLITAGLIEKC